VIGTAGFHLDGEDEIQVVAGWGESLGKEMKAAATLPHGGPKKWVCAELLGFGWVFASSEAWGGAQLGSYYLWVGAGGALGWWWGRSADFFG
jgi:hypothetical protein